MSGVAAGVAGLPGALGSFVPRPRSRRGRARPEELPELPAWPVYLLYIGFAGWWLLGMSSFAVAICSVPMAILLWLRRGTTVPKPFFIWIVFMMFVGASVTSIDSGGRLVGYAMRSTSYIGASIVFVYIYNCSEKVMPPKRLFGLLMGFLGIVAVGGWLGVLFPYQRLNTITYYLLPGSISGNSYVQALVRPTLAEIQQPYGSPIAFARPNAPFPYSNGWGCASGLLVPVLVNYVFQPISAVRRAQLLGLLAVLMVPAVYTLNRGMFASMVLGLVYIAFRTTLQGRTAGLLTVGFMGFVGAFVVLFTPVVSLLSARLNYSSTTEDRFLLYRETWERTLQSPLLGYGGPRPSQYLDVSLGTQGQFWTIMFSYGLPALVLYMAFFLWAAWATRSATGVLLGFHVVLVLVLATMFFYGYDGPQLSIGMACAAVVLRVRHREAAARRSQGELRPWTALAPGLRASEGHHRAPAASDGTAPTVRRWTGTGPDTSPGALSPDGAGTTVVVHHDAPTFPSHHRNGGPLR